MKRISIALVIVVLLSLSPASASLVTAPDGGVAPDGSVNYIFPAGSPFFIRGPRYPMPQPYWIPPVNDPAAHLGATDSTGNLPINPDAIK